MPLSSRTNRRVAARLSICAFLPAFVSGASLGQPEISVSGTVVNQRGEPVSDVTLRWTHSSHDVAETTTNATGAYVVSLATPTVIEAGARIVPSRTELLQNYPNPFNPGTTIPLRVSDRAGLVSLDIYNALGQKVRRLLWESLSGGQYEIRWNGMTDAGFPAAAGVYLLVLTSDSAVEVRKMLRLDGGGVMSADAVGVTPASIDHAGKPSAALAHGEGTEYTVALSAHHILDRIETLIVGGEPGIIDFVVDERFVWTTKAPMPIARQEITAATHDDLIYIFGGLDDESTSLDLVDVYNPATDTWVGKSPMPLTLNHLAAVTVGDHIYVLGGYISSSREISNQTWQYDPTDDTWARKTDMPAPRGAHGAAVIDGLAYVVGGISPDGSEDLVMIYDPRQDIWMRGASMPVLSEHLAVGAADGKVFAISGRFSGSRDEVQAYDVATDSWELRSRIPTPRSGIAALSWSGQIYVFGGELPGVFAENEVYDPVADHWGSGPPMPTARHGLAGGLVDGKFYIIGGGTVAGLRATDVVEEYVP